MRYTLTVYQDGNCFYSNEEGFLLQAPFPVFDYDMEAAEHARCWFIAEMRRRKLSFRFENN